MNLNKLLRKFSFVLILLAFLASNALAQTTIYVNGNNGDDLLGDGTSPDSGKAFKTISHALTVADSGDVISIAAETYTEDVTITDEITLVATPYLANTKVILNGNLTITTNTANDIVKIGVTGNPFEINTGKNLTLNEGDVQITTANFILPSNVIFTIKDGSINNIPTYKGDVNLSYTSTSSVNAGSELPDDLGNGALTVNLSDGTKSFSIGKPFAVKDLSILSGNSTFGGDVDVTGDIAITDTLDLGGFALNYNPDASKTLTNTGIVTNGKVVIDGSKATSIEGLLPTLEILSTRSASVTTSANVTLMNDFILSSATTDVFQLGTDTLFVKGKFDRKDNTAGNFKKEGTVVFNGTADQLFNSGSSLELQNLVIDNSGNTVELQAAVKIAGDFTVTAGSKVDVADYHIRFTSTGGTFTNNGTLESNSGNGYLISESAAGTTTFTGSGLVSNLDIRNGSTVDVNGKLRFAGNLILRDGDLKLDAGDTLSLATTTLAPLPKITVYAGDGSVTSSGSASIMAETNVLYNLEYINNAAATTAGLEWVGASINNLTVKKGSADGTITAPAELSTVAGKLDVQDNQILKLSGKNLVLTGSSIDNTVDGDITTSATDSIFVQGDNSTLKGSSKTTSIPTLVVDLAAGETFACEGIQDLNGDLVVNNGDATVKFVDDGSTSVSLTGNLVITDGSLNLSMASASAQGQSVGNQALLTGGSLTLGTDISVEDTTFHVGTAINLGTNKFIVKETYNHTGSGAITGTGTFVLDYSNVPSDSTVLKLTKELSVTNFEFAPSATGKDTVLVADSNLVVTGKFTLKNGVLDLQGENLKLQGTEFHHTDGFLQASTGNLIVEKAASILTEKTAFTVPNLTINTENGTDNVVLKTDDPGTKTATFTVNNFTQTKGNLSFDDNELVVTTDYSRTAGNVTMTTGFFTFDGGPTVDQGASWSVKNLAVKNGKVTMATDNPFTVASYLKLSDTLDANTSSGDPTQLTLSDNATIERDSTIAILSENANFDGTINLVYSSVSTPIVTSGEVPKGTGTTGVLKNFTVNGPVQLADSLNALNGTLMVKAALDLNGKEILMAQDSKIVLYDGGSLTAPLTPGTNSFEVEYAGAYTGNTSDNELDPSFKIKNLIFNSTADITLHKAITIDGDVTFKKAGNLDLDAKKLTLKGDLVQESTGFIFEDTGADLEFSGNNAQNLELASDLVIYDGSSTNFNVIINKDAGSEVTLKGGNLDFATNNKTLTLTSGAINTDATSKIILKQTSNNGVPVQGYTRTNGVITGNVEKRIDKDSTVANSVVIFPTGTIDGKYRPATFYFKTAPQSSFDLLVNHENVSPKGTNGMPINLDNFAITNYPGFYWYTKVSPNSVAPSYKYDLELGAEGYTDYVNDEIENVRLVRRDSGNVDNPWVLQGSDSNYDNSTVAADFPKVKVIDAVGGLTVQGSRFAYSQNNKPPKFTAELGDVTVDEGDTVKATYTAEDVDLNDTFTFSVVYKPEGSTFDATTGKFEWITDKLDAGKDSVIIRATDSYGSYKDSKSIITVNDKNQLPMFTSAPGPDTVKVPEGSVKTITFAASDPDTDNDGFTYTFVSTPVSDSMKIVDTTGVFTFHPAFEQEGDKFEVTVTVTDSKGGTADTTFNIEVVNQNRAPKFVTAMADTNVDEGATLTLDFKANATDPDGDDLTFSFTLTKDGETVSDSGAIDENTGIYTWTPNYTQAGVYELVVTATDDVDSAMDTVAVTVNNKNAAPTWVKVLPDTTIFVGDTLKFTYKVEDADNDPVRFFFNGPADSRAKLDSVTGMLTWDPITENDFVSLVKVKAIVGTDTLKTEAEVTVTRTTVTVSGTVSYDGVGAIDSAVVVLKQGETVVATDTTDLSGNYSFTDIDAGDYTVMVSKDINWPEAEVLASDALLAARSATDTSVHLTDMQKLAADVDGNTVVTAADALQILQRVVKLVDNFAVSDWLFESKDVKVGTKNVTVDIKGIAAGDVNKSAQPTSSKKEASVSYVQDEMMQISPNAEFEIPVKLDAMEDVSAFTMNFSYPAEKMELVGVKSAKQVVSNAKDGKLAIAWADLSGKESFEAAGDAVIVLKFKATEAFKSSESANVELESAEVVNKLGKDVNSSVSTNGVEISIPNKFALNNNYPNPFNPTTTISYDLPVQGKVTLTIFNSLGQEVAKLVNGVQEAGSYKQVWNATNVASGVYFFNITVEGTKNFTQTKKMVLLK